METMITYCMENTCKNPTINMSVQHYPNLLLSNNTYKRNSHTDIARNVKAHSTIKLSRSPEPNVLILDRGFETTRLTGDFEITRP